jgi:HSP20 family molecular chaperone IbpA
MKRMYVTLIVIFVFGLWTLTALSQMGSAVDQSAKSSGTQFDRMKRRMELREEMHRRIVDKLMNGVGSDQNLFQDLEQEFEDLRPDSFSGMKPSANFSSEWVESKSGRTLVITPKDPEQKMNIDVNATQITIKGEVQHKTGNSTYSSSFTNSFPVPSDCDGSKVKMDSKDGKLLVELPYKTAKQVQPIKSKPINKTLTPIEGEVQI